MPLKWWSLTMYSSIGWGKPLLSCPRYSCSHKCRIKSSLGPSIQERDWLKLVQWKVTKTVRVLKHMMDKKTRLAGVCLAPGKKKKTRLRGELIAIFVSAMERRREQWSSSTQKSAFKGPEKGAPGYSKGNFVHVEGKKKESTMRTVKHWNRNPE